MTAAFTFTPEADFVGRALDAEFRGDSEAVGRKLRTMLAALDDALAGISDARKELHTLYAATERGSAGGAAAHDQDLSTQLNLAHAESDLRAAAAILCSHCQTHRPPLTPMPAGDSKDISIMLSGSTLNGGRIQPVVQYTSLAFTEILIESGLAARSAASAIFCEIRAVAT